MFACTVASVENWDRCSGGGLVSRALDRMAQDKDVAVTFEALDRIG